MKKHTYITIFLFVPNILMAGEWFALNNTEIINQENIVENKLWEYLNNTSQVKFRAREKYKYQYTKEGEKIYINAFCDSWEKRNLNNELVIVKDGGSCYFRINYNLKTEKFSKLYVNGEV